MIKRCEACQAPFEAKRPTRKTCSERCRKRIQRGSASITALEPGTVDHDGLLASATRRRLESAGRLESELGVAALLLAARLDSLVASDTGGGLAALMKEFRATLAEAVRDAEADHDALDDIREAAALKLIRGRGA